MEHKLSSVEELAETSKDLYTDLVLNEGHGADSILNNLKQGINDLKNNWKGTDAGYRIQELVNVHNSIVEIRNFLALLAVETSKVAADYREIQIINGSSKGPLDVLCIDTRSKMANYTDVSPGVDINPAVNNGKVLLDYANDLLNSFKRRVEIKYDEVENNWAAGPKRNDVLKSFNTFLSSVNKHIKTLSDVSENISRALGNYESMY